MRGREFLDQARDSLPGNRPRQRRSAIIHAYYALLLECRELMARWGLPALSRQQVHAQVRLRLIYSSNADLKRIGDTLEDLGKHRNIASYDLRDLHLFATAADAQADVKVAADAIALLDAIDAARPAAPRRSRPFGREVGTISVRPMKCRFLLTVVAGLLHSRGFLSNHCSVSGRRMGLLNWFRRKKRPAIPPAKLILCSIQYFLDGGTAILNATDERGREHAVMLVQNAFADGNTFGIPGRLYFDGEPIPVRSELESQVLSVLRAAEIQYGLSPDEENGESIQLSRNLLILGDDIKQVLSRGPEQNIRALRDQVIERVESPQYVSFANEAGEAK